MKLNSLVLLLAISLTGTTFGQEEVIIIDKGAGRHSKKREVKHTDNTRVVKFAPLNMLMGEINFGYEHKIDNKSSLDFEFGPTISEIGFGVNTHYVSNIYNQNYSVKSSGLGVVAAVGYRYYPLDETEALNRFYISPVLKYKLRTFGVNSADPSVNIGSRTGSENQLNFYFNFGHQVWLSKSFALDFYCGVGIGYQSKVDYFIDSEYQYDEWVSTWRKQQGSGARYVFNAGIKVGIGSKKM